MSPEEIKRFEDPLMGRLDKKEPAKTVAVTQKSKLPMILLGVGLAAVLGTVIYFLYQAQQRIEALNADLAKSQEHIESVSQTLQQSREQIGTLEKGLGQSQSQLSAQGDQLARYKSLYSDLKGQQGEQGKELEAISIRKADQAQVDDLKAETSGVQQQVGELNSRMTQVNSNISDLRQQTTRNRGDLDSHSATLDQLRSTTAANADEISGIKRSLDREYYNFELQKKGGVMKVFEVALSLKGTDFKKQRYTLEVLAGGQRLEWKNQNINAPIYFYVEGVKKPYEVLVNRVDKNFVVGHLSVPKG